MTFAGAAGGAASAGAASGGNPYAMAFGAVGGYIGGQKEEKFMKKQVEAQRLALGRMKKQQKRGMRESRLLFERAMEQLNSIGGASRQALVESGQQRMAQVQSSAIGTGLTGTTAFQAGMGRSTQRDISREMGLLEERLAGSRANLLTGRSQQRYGERMDRANILQRTKYDSSMEGYQPGGTAASYASLGSAMGQGFGAWMGAGQQEQIPRYEATGYQGDAR